MKKMNVTEFRNRLKSELEDLCQQNGWDSSNSTRMGQAFAVWCAQQIADNDSRFDTDADDSLTDGRKDLQVDLVFTSDSSGETLICQCKYVAGGKALDAESAEAILSLHDKLARPGFVAQYGNPELQQALPPTTQFTQYPSKFTYRLVTNARVPEASISTITGANGEAGAPRYELWDRSELTRFYTQTQSFVDPTPEEVVVCLPPDSLTEFNVPHKGIIARLPTNALRQLWEKYAYGIIAQNIRGPLNTAINSEMRETLKNRPDEFFYFNNGVSAICKDFRIDEGEQQLIAKELQIINGAQTLQAIGFNEEVEEARVLFRLTKVMDEPSGRRITREIIRYNNRQIPVRDSDFRSNDDIQEWLQQEFARSQWRWPALPRRHYVRKRGAAVKRGVGKALKLEDMAKIRFAWLYDPVTINDAGRSLYQDADSGGKYSRAFGVEGESAQTWPIEVLDDAVLAVWFYEEIDRALRAARDRDRERNAWLPKRKWHFLSLAGEFAKSRQLDAGKLLQEPDRCREEFRDFIQRSWRVVTAAEDRRRNQNVEGGGSMSHRNWLRSQDQWSKLLNEFRMAASSDETLESILEDLS